MGSYPSYLSYKPQNDPDRSHVHGHQSSQDYHLALSSPKFDVYTRLLLLEKDFENAQVENAKKDVVIEYLLRSNANQATVEDKTQKLGQEASILKKNISQVKAENRHLKDNLRKALDAIFALSTPLIPGNGPQQASTSCGSGRKISDSEAAMVEDLIDFLGPCEKSANAELTEEDTTLLENSYNDVSGVGDVSKKTLPEQNLSDSFTSDSSGSFYIHHFVTADGETTDSRRGGKMAAEVELPPDAGNAATLREQVFTLAASMDSKNSSPQDSSSPSGPVSAYTSFSESITESTPSDVILIKPTTYDVRPGAAFECQDWNLDKAFNAMKKFECPIPALNISKQAACPSQSFVELPETSEPLPEDVIKPCWKIAHVFDSRHEREKTVFVDWHDAGAPDLRFPDLFKYGIRFNPDDSERDIYRSITISGLPSDVNLGELLNQVRGGVILEAHLLDTLKITGKITALITFVHEHPAMAYEDHAKMHPIKFNGCVVQVAVVPTPTWPIKTRLRKAIFDHRHTRCLEVHNFPREISPAKLKNDLGVCSEMSSTRIIHMNMRNDGILELHFSSIGWAGHAFGLFTCFRAYRNCTVNFVPDPCARPVETLFQEGSTSPAAVTKALSPNLAAISNSKPSAISQSR